LPWPANAAIIEILSLALNMKAETAAPQVIRR